MSSKSKARPRKPVTRSVPGPKLKQWSKDADFVNIYLKFFIPHGVSLKGFPSCQFTPLLSPDRN